MAPSPVPEPSPPAASDFLFGDLAIEPPLAEFERVFEKKLRSFESAEDPARAQPYRKAYELGRQKLASLLGGEGRC